MPRFILAILVVVTACRPQQPTLEPGVETADPPKPVDESDSASDPVVTSEAPGPAEEPTPVAESETVVIPREANESPTSAPSPLVRPALDKEEIRRVIRANLNEVRYCYNQGLAQDPNLAGRVAVKFTISPDGTVSDSIVVHNNLPDKRVAECIAKSVKRRLFPEPRGGGNVVVTYPFVLEPGDGTTDTAEPAELPAVM